MAGSNTPNQNGIYGALGVASADNVPGARSNSVTWVDASGNFWIFGGFGFDSNGTQGQLNDLWRYSAGRWTWMSGSKLGEFGLYSGRQN
jgi:N-acetylneuraminic acid mutarotase